MELYGVPFKLEATRIFIVIGTQTKKLIVVSQYSDSMYNVTHT